MITADELKALTTHQASFTASMLSDYALNGGTGSDDGHDALCGAVDVVAVLIDLEFDSDVEGFDTWIRGDGPDGHPFQFASVDGFCEELFKLAEATDDN